jgi:hypothetical protein
MSAKKWITIGSVKSGHSFMWRNWGVPCGLLMHWRGNTHRFQPMQFLDWPELVAAVRIRLALARLELVALASVVSADRLVRGAVELIALVMRMKRNPKREN